MNSDLFSFWYCRHFVTINIVLFINYICAGNQITSFLGMKLIFILEGSASEKVISLLGKDVSATDFIPYLSDFVRNNIDGSRSFNARVCFEEYPFDRYPTL